MAYRLGIDLGTTFTCAAIVDGEGRAELIGLGGRSPSIPSVVLVRDDGAALFGDTAESRGALDPTRVAREFKRRLGDPAELVLGGMPYSAQTLTSMLLRHVAETVATRQGGPPERTVIAHPASYSEYRLEILLNAATEAGLPLPSLVPEPVAAATHYLTKGAASGELIAIYDFGGGTFDVALVRCTDHGPQLLGAPVGVDSLGGIDFDRALVELVDDRCGGQLAELANDEAGMAVLARLRRDCREAKELLSSDDETAVTVLLPSGPRQIELTRAELARIIKPRLGETFRALRRATESADVSLDAIDRIVLVGGSSRIPSIRDQVRVETGRPIAEDIDPEHAVALGAALHRATVVAQPASEPRPPDPLSDPEVPVPLPPPVPRSTADPSPAPVPGQLDGGRRKTWVAFALSVMGMALSVLELNGIYANREEFIALDLRLMGVSLAEEAERFPSLDSTWPTLLRIIALGWLAYSLLRFLAETSAPAAAAWLAAGSLTPLVLAGTRYGSFWSEVNNGDFGWGAAASVVSIPTYFVAWTTCAIVALRAPRRRPLTAVAVLVVAGALASVVGRLLPLEDSEKVRLFRIDLSDSIGLAGSNSPGWVAVAVVLITVVVALATAGNRRTVLLAGAALCTTLCVIEAQRAVTFEFTDPIALTLYSVAPIAFGWGAVMSHRHREAAATATTA